MLSSTETASDQNTDTSSHSQTSTGLLDSLWYGYKIIGDNLDMNIKPRHMTSEDKTKSLHCFHLLSVRDRVPVSHLSYKPQVPPILIGTDMLLPNN